MKHVIKGNLVSLTRDGKFDVIVHGCNCFNTMGKGIALDIKNYFRYAFDVDCSTIKGDIKKLGTYTSATCFIGGKDKIAIVNAYTQFDYWSNGVLVDYEAIEKIFKQLAIDFKGKHIAYHAIGAGLAKGDWEKISSIIDNAFADVEHTYVIWDGSKVV